MSDEEFDVLDELYFVQHFKQLQELTEKNADDLKKILIGLNQKGWIKVNYTVDDEVTKPIKSTAEMEDYYFMATKEGLMAHNS